MARSLEGTEFSKIPVKLGMMKPPKKRTNHKKMITHTKLSKKGIGRALKEANKDTKKHRVRALLLV